MTARPYQALSALLLLMLLCSGAAHATTVYKSVDAEGRVTFSDQPPTETTLVEILEYRVPDTEPSALDTARLQAMRETTDRMAADRREREAARARVRADAAAARAASTPPTYEYYGQAGYYPAWPVFGRPIVRPPYHRPPHGRPPHGRPPLVKPPYARPAPYNRHGIRVVGRYSQHPANLIRRGYSSRAREVFYGPRR